MRFLLLLITMAVCLTACSRILGSSEASISFHFSQTTRSVFIFLRFSVLARSSRIPSLPSFFYTRSLMSLGCTPVAAIPSNRSKPFETTFNMPGRGWRTSTENILRQPKHCGRRAHNPASPVDGGIPLESNTSRPRHSAATDSRC